MCQYQKPKLTRKSLQSRETLTIKHKEHHTGQNLKFIRSHRECQCR